MEEKAETQGCQSSVQVDTGVIGNSNLNSGHQTPGPGFLLLGS